MKKKVFWLEISHSETFWEYSFLWNFFIKWDYTLTHISLEICYIHKYNDANSFYFTSFECRFRKRAVTVVFIRRLHILSSQQFANIWFAALQAVRSLRKAGPRIVIQLLPGNRTAHTRPLQQARFSRIMGVSRIPMDPYLAQTFGWTIYLKKRCTSSQF